MEALYSPRRRVVTYGKSIRKPIPHIHTLEGSAQGHVTSGDSEASRKRRRIQNSMPAQPLAKAPRSANRGQQDEVASTLSLRDRAHGGVNDAASDDQATLDGPLECVFDVPSSGKDQKIKQNGLQQRIHEAPNKCLERDAPTLSAPLSSASSDTSQATSVRRTHRCSQAHCIPNVGASRDPNRVSQATFSPGTPNTMAAFYPGEGDPTEGPSIKAKLNGSLGVQTHAAVAKTRRWQMIEDVAHPVIGSAADKIEDAYAEQHSNESESSSSRLAKSNVAPCSIPPQQSTLGNSVVERDSHASPTGLNMSSLGSVEEQVRRFEANVRRTSELRGKSPSTPGIVHPTRLVDKLRQHGQCNGFGQYSSDGHRALNDSKKPLLRTPSTEFYNGPLHTLSQSSTMSEEAAQSNIASREKNNKPKVTYASQRSYLDDTETVMHPSTITIPVSPVRAKRALHIASVPKSLGENIFDQNVHDDTHNQTTTLRTVHELRKAGNASRLGNEMETLLEEATEGSLSDKRSKLSNFISKFKDSSFRDIFMRKELYFVIFGSMVPQEDVALNLLIVSAASYVLRESVPSHCLELVNNETFITMLISLLDLRDPLGSSERLRHSSMSRACQRDYEQFFDELSTGIVWSFEAPIVITGRILSLQSLEHIVFRQAQQDAANNHLPETAIHKLWDIIQDSSLSTTQDENLKEVQLSLSILSRCRVGAGATVEKKPWAMKAAHIITMLLDSRDQPLHNHGDQILIPTLTLGLDLAQNGSVISGRIATPGVIRNSAVFLIGALSHKLGHLDCPPTLLDRIILNLGFLINLVESCVSARRHFLRRANGDVPVLDGLLRIFQDGSKDAGEVGECCLVCAG